MIASLLFAAVLASRVAAVAVPAGPAIPPLIEANRITFETPFSPSAGEVRVAVSRRAAIGYTISHEDLFVVDLTTGGVDAVIDLRSYEPRNFVVDFGVAVAEDGASPRLLVWGVGYPTLVVFDLSDPALPSSPATLDLGNRTYDLFPVPGGPRVVLWTDRSPELLDLDLGFITATFVPVTGPSYGNRFTAIAVGGSPTQPLLALADASISYTSFGVAVYDVSTPSPNAIAVFNPTQLVDQLLVDRGRRFLVVGRTTYVGSDRRSVYETVDLSTGAHLAEVTPFGGGSVSALAQGGGANALVTVDAEGIDVVDLADPSAPRVVGRVPSRNGWGGYDPPNRGGLAAFLDGPYVAVAAEEDEAVPVIDVRTATVAGRLDMTPTPPAGIAIGADQSGRRSLLAIGARVITYDVAVPGGTAEIVAGDLTNPANPRETGRTVRNAPRFVDGFATLGGSTGVALDFTTNSIALVRMKDGAVLDVTGFDALNGTAPSNWGLPWVLTHDPYVLAWGEQGYVLLRVDHGRFVRLASEADPYDDYRGAGLRPDGTAVLFGADRNGWKVETRLPDGRRGRLPVENPPSMTTFSVAPDGARAILGFPFDWDEPGHAKMIDLTDPLNPAWGWDAMSSFWSSQFDPSGRRLFVTFAGASDGSFQTGLFDPVTGAALGGLSEPIDKFYYEDIGVTIENNGSGRAVLWKWTFVGWETALFDTSGTTPRLMEVFPEYFVGPEFASRDDAGWYEVHADRNSSDIFVSDADGHQTLGASHGGFVDRLPAEMRRGFLATAFGGYTGGAGLSLWRDTALNRPPAAAAGGDRTLECAGPAGTPVHLDGSGSSDPDSTPGTNDDIASFVWTIGGGSPIDGVTEDATLPLGVTPASLVVTDVLGLAGRDGATIMVQDTLPPDIALQLKPVIENGVWAHLWTPAGSAHDHCDGDLGAPAERLRLPAGAAGATTAFIYNPARSIELRREQDGSAIVRLIGPSSTEMSAIWAATIDRGGFALKDGAPVEMLLSEAGKGKDVDLLYRWELTADGLVSAANAFGQTGDHVVDAQATDRTGNQGSARASLRALIAGACGSLPPGAECLGAPGRSVAAPKSQSGRRAAIAR